MSREREHERDHAPSPMREILIGLVWVGAVIAGLVGKAVVGGGKAAARVGEEIVAHPGSLASATRAAVVGGRAAAGLKLSLRRVVPSQLVDRQGTREASNQSDVRPVASALDRRIHIPSTP